MTLPPWNAVRYAPGNDQHVESYFLKLNDAEGRRALWLKTTILARPAEAPVAEAWAIAFDRREGHRAAKQVMPFADARFGTDGLDVQVGEVVVKDGKTRGVVESRGTRIAWDLAFSGDAAPIVPFPTEAMYTGSFPRSKVVSPYPDVRFDGFYEVDGVRHEVSGFRGMQGHNWGTSHTHQYAWGHCNVFDGEPELVFEGMTGRVRVGPLVAPPLTVLCVRYRGVRYEWNRPSDLLLSSAGDMGLRSWRFAAHSDIGAIAGHMTASDDDFVGLLYENPVGAPAYCLNSKIARCSLAFTPAGRPTLRASSAAAALELGTTDPGHGIRILA